MRLVAAVLLSVALAFAQANQSNGKVVLPENTVKIDGHVTPNAISDAVALRMLYVMSAPKTGVSSAAAPKALEPLFAQMPAADKAKLLERIQHWQLQAPAGLPAKRSFAEMEALVNSDLAELHAKLSGQGWGVLKAELDRRKAFIKIYEVPAERGGK